jgi:hypothetical protein
MLGSAAANTTEAKEIQAELLSRSASDADTDLDKATRYYEAVKREYDWCVKARERRDITDSEMRRVTNKLDEARRKLNVVKRQVGQQPVQDAYYAPKRRGRAQNPSQARVDDMSKNTKKYFPTYEQASAWAKSELARAKAAGEQTQDRFYIWSAGEIYTIGDSVRGQDARKFFGDYTPAEKEAYRKGEKKGESSGRGFGSVGNSYMTANPYPEGSDEWRAWRFGYDAGRGN